MRLARLELELYFLKITGKVFSRLNFSIPDDILQSVAAGKPGVIEFILQTLRSKVNDWLQCEHVCH